jgi:23S rRNA (cytidine1920-2'-O)/16S rRNA (cytidine1409-2'-O)-methyltransferase
VRRRLDLEMVRRGLARTQTEAAESIRSGGVLVERRPALKPETLVAPTEQISITGRARRYVSRGGEKLEAAIAQFGLDVEGRRCLDAGASTGGFTDALLAHGADHVIAVDVGYGQLAWGLRTDPRVTVIERRNVRDLSGEDLPYAPDLLVADLSFISLTKVIGPLANVAAPDAEFVLLVKPQFEASRELVEPGGVVRDPEGWRTSIAAVENACRTQQLGSVDVMASPVVGPAGNVEFFVRARKGAVGRMLDVRSAIEEGVEIRNRKHEGRAPASERSDGPLPSKASQS